MSEGVRRSSRKRIKLHSTSEASINSDDGSFLIEEKAVRKRMTKAKAKVSKKRGKGKLAGFFNMPMDILFEIFGHLQPLDILNLARITKEFRRILMHRSSRPIWKAACANIPALPACPPDMSEPQWVHLVYYPFCNICFRPGIRNVDWHLRLRICSKCAKEHIEEVSVYWCHYDDELVSYRDLVPYRPGKRNKMAFFLDEYVALLAKYHAIGDQDGRRAFLEERSKAIKEIKDHADLCEQWASGQAQDRSQELQDLKHSRKKDIIDKLTALGWGEEIEKIQHDDNIGNHRLVKLPHRLTERIWNNIRDTMIGYMEEMKAKRLARERKELILVRKRIAINILRSYKISQLPFTSIMPEPCDFCLFPAIKEVIEQPVEIDMDESSFTEIVPLLPGIFDEWRADIHKQLVKKVKGDLRNENENSPSDEVISERINLATTVFKCSACSSGVRYRNHSMWDDEYDDYDDYGNHFDGYDSEYDFDYHPFFGDSFAPKSKTAKPLFYPNVLAHRCLTKPRGWYPGINDPIVRLDTLTGHRQQWSCDDLVVDKSAGKIVDILVDLCNLDPASATAGDMDELDARFACTVCYPIIRDRSEPTTVSTFGWREAVKHGLGFYHSSPDAWYRVNEFEESDKQVDSFLGDDEDVWLCMLCHDLPKEKPPMDIYTVKTHITMMHDISEPVLNRHYAWDFAVPEVFVMSEITLPVDQTNLAASLSGSSD